ncbi:MAG: hypothetical protein SH807_01395 [Blastochloris sp.]|nr:hypothetical protein [Blastochloris sp.]
MTSLVILLSFVGFILGLSVHVFWWRISRPVKDVPALILCVIGIPLILVIVFKVAYPTFSNQEFLALLFLSCLHGAHYVTLYPAWQAGSPTVLVVLEIERSGPSSALQLEQRISEKLVCEETFNRLLNENWVLKNEAGFLLDRYGRSLTGICKQWRKLLRLPDGSG